MAELKCGCTGNIDSGNAVCPALATQEDFLCDHCRVMRCWEMTWRESLSLPAGECIRRGCLEHNIAAAEMAGRHG